MSRSSKSITLAADNAAGILRRFQAEAERIAGEQNGAKMVRAVLDQNGLHAVISDGHSTIEIANGAVAVSVKQEVEE
jgi:hypothetical protein